MKLTGRGLKVLIALSLLLALGYLTYDYVLTALSLVGVAVLLYEALRLKAKFANLAPPESEVKVRMLAGGEREVNLKLNVPEGSGVSSPYPWAEVRLAGGLLTLKLKPEVKGVYRLEKVVLKLTGPLGLLEAVRELPLKVEVKAYPRALPFIVEALRLLGARGVGVGIVPSEDKGIGLEYAETREYRPGDPLRLIDWKATARLSKLMVKEFFKDGEGYPYVVYNGLALGPITSDELTALLLSLLIGLSRHYPSLNLTLKLGRDDVLTGYSMSTLEALRAALAYALREYREAEHDVYEVVEPEEADRLVAILRRIKREGLPKAFSVKGKGLPELSSGKGELFLVGLPMYDTKELLRLAYRVKLSGGRVVLLSPNKPWRDVNDLERAYLIYVSFKKSLASFRRLGAEVKLWGRLGSIS